MKVKSNHFVKYYSNSSERIVRLRKASKNLVCSECDGVIRKNNHYIRNKYRYYNFHDGFDSRKTPFICLKCWRGEMPKKVSSNNVIRKR